MDGEDYFYLKKFEDKIGTITEQNKSKSGTYTYRIDFDDDRFGYFYENDFFVLA